MVSWMVWEKSSWSTKVNIQFILMWVLKDLCLKADGAKNEKEAEKKLLVDYMVNTKLKKW